MQLCGTAAGQRGAGRPESRVFRDPGYVWSVPVLSCNRSHCPGDVGLVWLGERENQSKHPLMGTPTSILRGRCKLRPGSPVRAPRGRCCSLSFPGTSGEESDVSSGKARQGPLARGGWLCLVARCSAFCFLHWEPGGHTQHTQGRRKLCLLSVSPAGRIGLCTAPFY